MEALHAQIRHVSGFERVSVIALEKSNEAPDNDAKVGSYRVTWSLSFAEVNSLGQPRKSAF